MDIKDILSRLCSAPGVGSLDCAAKLSAEILAEYADEVKVENGSVYGIIYGENTDYTIMLDAHIDEIAMIVTSVLDNGFIKVAQVGGLDPRTLAAQRVNIWGKEPIIGVFASTPPHIKKDGESELNVNEMFIDACCDNVKDIVSPGDLVTFRVTPANLLADGFTCKSLDDRSGVASLIYAAYLIKEQGKKPPVNVSFLFSDKEELGGMGAATMSYAHFPNEAVAVDVGFGDYPGFSDDETCKMGKGTMLGFSPTLSNTITQKLKSVAEEKGIPYQYDVMGGRTGTNADRISVTKSGVPCGLLSIPIRSMHTTVENLFVEDLCATGKLLAEYVMKAGVAND